jgi:amino acid permease
MFFGIISLISIFVEKSLFRDGNQLPENFKAHAKGGFIEALSIILTSYGFIYNLFPIYISIEGRNNTKGMQAISMALFIVCIVYVGFSILAIDVYGD